ncbi:MAG: hypothetical protein ACYC2G_13225 [Gemmatimonadaceae bacterium]
MSDPARAREPAATWSDATLLAAMRREETPALAEFYARHLPLLRRLARRWGLGPADAEAAATDTLTDVALALMMPGAAAPRALAAYLATALRHRLGMTRRTASRRAAHAVGMEMTGDDAATPRAGIPRAVAEPTVVSALCSAYALRASRGGGDDAGTATPPVDPALERLVARVEDELREPDRLLLVWLAHHVPLRTIAEWQGVRYDTAVKRATRLRERLRAVVVAHVDALPVDDRLRLQRILARAGAAIATPDPEPAAPAAAATIVQESDR